MCGLWRGWIRGCFFQAKSSLEGKWWCRVNRACNILHELLFNSLCSSCFLIWMTVLQRILFAHEKMLRTGDQAVLHPLSSDILGRIVFWKVDTTFLGPESLVAVLFYYDCRDCCSRTSRQIRGAGDLTNYLPSCLPLSLPSHPSAPSLLLCFSYFLFDFSLSFLPLTLMIFSDKRHRKAGF